MVRHPKTCPPEATVAEVRMLFGDPHLHAALILGHDDILIAVIDRADLSTALACDEQAAGFGRLDGRTITGDAPLARTHDAMSTTGRRRLAVIDASTAVLGLLCLKGSGSGFCSDRDVYARSLDPQSPAATPNDGQNTSQQGV